MLGCSEVFLSFCFVLFESAYRHNTELPVAFIVDYKLWDGVRLVIKQTAKKKKGKKSVFWKNLFEFLIHFKS